MPKNKPPAESLEKQQLARFISRFSPEIASLARAALSTMRDRLPGAFELVYDNAYALVVGFGPTPKPSEAVFSLVIYPKKVSLCFLYGAHLTDAEHLLQGSGNQVRHIRLESAETLEKRSIHALMNVSHRECNHALLRYATRPNDCKSDFEESQATTGDLGWEVYDETKPLSLRRDDRAAIHGDHRRRKHDLCDDRSSGGRRDRRPALAPNHAHHLRKPQGRNSVDGSLSARRPRPSIESCSCGKRTATSTLPT